MNRACGSGRAQRRDDGVRESSVRVGSGDEELGRGEKGVGSRMVEVEWKSERLRAESQCRSSDSMSRMRDSVGPPRPAMGPVRRRRVRRTPLRERENWPFEVESGLSVGGSMEGRTRERGKEGGGGTKVRGPAGGRGSKSRRVGRRM